MGWDSPQPVAAWVVAWADTCNSQAARRLIFGPRAANPDFGGRA